MPGDLPSPDPKLIYSLYLGVYKPQALRIALLLDLFSPLADGSASAPEPARACGCDEFAPGALLNYLGCLELLERQCEA